MFLCQVNNNSLIGMEHSIIGDLDKQISCAQETLILCNSIKEKLSRLESEKNEALNTCMQLEAQLERLKKEKCSNCTFLLRKLREERLEKEKLKKEEKAKLLKRIAKTLESIDDGNTNHMTNAQQLFTQMVFDGIDESGEKSKITLVEDSLSDGDSPEVLADETIIAIESEDLSNDDNPRCKVPVVPVIVPETECQGSNRHNVKPFLNTFNPSSEVQQGSSRKENTKSEEECETHHIEKKQRCEKILPPLNGKSNTSRTVASNRTSVKNSPSVLVTYTSNLSKTSGGISCPEEPSTSWKMKPSFLVDSGGKRMKQMTLSLTRPEKEKKHDISLSEKFKGGVTNNQDLVIDEEKDVVLPSPDRTLKKFFSKKNESCETLEDPDLTVFQPQVTSTCHPLETSFDKVPENVESPPYKYRRETVRGKEKRLKLPGQDCDECAEYYKAAGLDRTQDLRVRMNECSRHRDKYQLRAHTPPGFWDPVLPVSPEGSQEIS